MYPKLQTLLQASLTSNYFNYLSVIREKSMLLMERAVLTNERILYYNNFCIFLIIIYRIGLGISTKAVGSWTREDITESYKYPESKSF